MQAGLLTLYCLAIGTLVIGCGATLWELHEQPGRRVPLLCWAAAYACYAIGCVITLLRPDLPGVSGWAVSNVLFTAGYALVLNGVGQLDHRRYVATSITLLVAVSLVWIIGGPAICRIMWDYGAAFPIALMCGLTAWHIQYRSGIQAPRSRPVVAAIAWGHGVFYLFRGAVMPLMVLWKGQHASSVFAEVTMYEGVLYSVAMPVALLSVVREESRLAMLKIAQTDFLTNIGNRHFFYQAGQKCLSGQTVGQPVSLLIFDIDHFKSINDIHGHAMGDAVLKLFARAMGEEVGQEAIMGRLGGEEFAMLLPGSDRATARAAGQNIARRFTALAAQDFRPPLHVTVSIGLTEVRTSRITLDDLLAAADGALYQAKTLGRNRIEFASAGAFHPAA
ncbi:diguanylate cyclase [Gluconacetobacter diazotrophicus PA1 5]|uniref:GGDEF domain-containing protein n=1 Tax=Gluconacetobacter diazotrophicus TaxID=33996 RepID=UPI000173C242|nr:GGDEF domain-containing protein [Gluconacetobacter diazotrophicus]ACI51988.1 diguanylate cyclase [Gluconacetobacter diazotrophicus PA1 5]TWB05181.1 diguanylate cyclase (GGDEF)-like protein [Gluconacetobacter diazotrophicus]